MASVKRMKKNTWRQINTKQLKVRNISNDTGNRSKSVGIFHRPIHDGKQTVRFLAPPNLTQVFNFDGSGGSVDQSEASVKKCTIGLTLGTELLASDKEKNDRLEFIAKLNEFDDRIGGFVEENSAKWKTKNNKYNRMLVRKTKTNEHNEEVVLPLTLKCKFRWKDDNTADFIAFDENNKRIVVTRDNVQELLGRGTVFKNAKLSMSTICNTDLYGYQVRVNLLKAQIVPKCNEEDEDPEWGEEEEEGDFDDGYTPSASVKPEGNTEGNTEVTKPEPETSGEVTAETDGFEAGEVSTEANTEPEDEVIECELDNE